MPSKFQPIGERETKRSRKDTTTHKIRNELNLEFGETKEEIGYHTRQVARQKKIVPQFDEGEESSSSKFSWKPQVLILMRKVVLRPLKS